LNTVDDARMTFAIEPVVNACDVTPLQHFVAIVQRMSVESLPPLPKIEVVWRFPRISLLIACAAAIASIWLFWDGLFRMWDKWIEAPEYSHALLIPPVAAFLIWQQKDSLERQAFSGSWWGVAIVLLGGVILLIGQVATIYTIVQYAYLVTVFGLVLALTGLKPFRLIVVPLLILVLMVPLPQFVFANLSADLQLLSSQIGVAFIRLFGISVFLEGNVIDLGSYKLQVAEACDGLRYLFPLMTIGFLIAYFYKGALWKRVLLFLSSIPITVIMNSFRIGTIGVMVEHWGIGMAEGFLHEFQGWAVFMASTALLLGEVALLHHLGRETGTWRQKFGVEFPAPSPRDAKVRSRPLPHQFLAACGLLLVFLAVATFIPRPVELTPARATFSEFPMHLDGWTRHDIPMEGIYLDTLKLDDYLLADFTDGGGSPVNLYVSYYYSQRKGEAFHSPRWCLPGGGWQMRDFATRSVNGVAIDGQPLRVNRSLMELGNQRELVYYWFQQRGRVVTNEYAVKWYLFWDALTRHRTDGSLVRLIVMLPPGSGEADGDKRLTRLAGGIVSILPAYVPD
jgi:exosortase D (VPLPA-CTERM-specific)